MSRAAWLASIALLLAGIVAFLAVLGGHAARRKRIGGHAATLAALRDLEQQSRDGRLLRKAFEGLDAPTPHEALVQAYLPGRAAAIKRLEPQPIEPGWRLERVSVDLHNVPWGEIATWLAKTSNERPPWRLTEFTVEAAQEGLGSGVFTFESPVRE